MHKKVQGTFNYDDAGDHIFPRKMDYIIFSADRDGGYGQADIYVSFKKDNGEWTDGINMGPEINTERFELAPYISPDDKYLFFTRREKWKKRSFFGHILGKLGYCHRAKEEDRKLVQGIGFAWFRLE